MTRGGERSGAGRKRGGREVGVAIGFRLPGEDARRFREKARKLGISDAELARRIVQAHLMAETWIAS